MILRLQQRPEIEKRLRDLDGTGRKCLTLNCQGLAAKRLRLVELILIAQDHGQHSQAVGDERMLRWQRVAANLQRFGGDVELSLAAYNAGAAAVDKFGGVPEYALAAYNAGDSRVLDWQSAGPYSGMDEFVESIPFTQTREYVQAILRNIEIYREIDASAKTPSKAASETSGN